MAVKIANPAPLGLLGFGLTTVLLNFVHNANLGPVDTMILGMGIAYGGAAQIVAGVLEFKRGNTFGTVAFSSYGFFWWSYVFINIFPRIGFGSYPSNSSLAAYFLMWGLFTAAMFFGTLKTSRALQFVFGSLATLFFLLTILFGILAYSPGANLDVFKQIIGIEGIITGASAVYLAIAEVLNEVHGRTVVPIGQLI